MKARLAVLISMVVAAIAITGCSTPAASSDTLSSYTPVTRSITMIGIPALVHEQQGTMDFLNTAFGDGGVLQDKEVYEWAPANITAYVGDTIDLTLVNPSDDAHTFDVPDLGVAEPLPGQGTAHVRFTVDAPGIHEYLCQVGEHLPYMTGQLVVLPAP